MIHVYIRASGSIIPSPVSLSFLLLPWLRWVASSHILCPVVTLHSKFSLGYSYRQDMVFLPCGRAYSLFIWNSLSIQVRLCHHMKFSLYIKLKSVISSVVHIFISNILALIKILYLNCCLLLNEEISANNNCQPSPAFITTSYSQLTMSPF